MSPRMTTPPQITFSEPILTSPMTVAFGKTTLFAISIGVKSYSENTVLAFEIFYPYLLAGWMALVWSAVSALLVERAKRMTCPAAVRNFPNIKMIIMYEVKQNVANRISITCDSKLVTLLSLQIELSWAKVSMFWESRWRCWWWGRWGKALLARKRVRRRAWGRRWSLKRKTFERAIRPVGFIVVRGHYIVLQVLQIKSWLFVMLDHRHKWSPMLLLQQFFPLNAWKPWMRFDVVRTSTTNSLFRFLVKEFFQ